MVYPRSVTHPDANRARRRATTCMLIETNALPLSQTDLYRFFSFVQGLLQIDWVWHSGLVLCLFSATTVLYCVHFTSKYQSRCFHHCRLSKKRVGERRAIGLRGKQHVIMRQRRIPTSPVSVERLRRIWSRGWIVVCHRLSRLLQYQLRRVQLPQVPWWRPVHWGNSLYDWLRSVVAVYVLLYSPIRRLAVGLRNKDVIFYRLSLKIRNGSIVIGHEQSMWAERERKMERSGPENRMSGSGAVSGGYRSRCERRVEISTAPAPLTCSGTRET